MNMQNVFQLLNALKGYLKKYPFLVYIVLGFLENQGINIKHILKNYETIKEQDKAI